MGACGGGSEARFDESGEHLREGLAFLGRPSAEVFGDGVDEVLAHDRSGARALGCERAKGGPSVVRIGSAADKTGVEQQGRAAGYRRCSAVLVGAVEPGAGDDVAGQRLAGVVEGEGIGQVQSTIEREQLKDVAVGPV